jgi:hypothetical protein
MGVISNTPRPGYVWDSADNVWYPIGVGAHQHTNAADTPAVIPYSTYAAAGKNKILNGDFSVWQRGTSAAIPDGTFARLADRFHIYMSGTYSATQSQQTFTPGTAPVSGYEGQYFWRNTISSITGSLSLNRFGQKIEDVRTLAGQTVTVSFWAKAGANASWTPQLVQEFGTGGSTTVFASGSAVSVTTSWQRFSQTISVPSVSGKTIGAGNCLTFIIDMPQTGAQTNDIWGVQVEAGSTVTAFQTATGNPASELAACQRYYQVATRNDGWGTGGCISTSQANAPIYFFNEMRTAPTIVLPATGTGTNQITFLTSSGTFPGTIGTISAAVITKNGFVASGPGFTGAFTAGNASILYVSGSTEVWKASAEL